MRTAIRNILTDLLVYFAICAAFILMMQVIIDYTSFNTNIHFLQVKQDYISNKVWLTAFYIHVFTAVFCVLAGLTQFSKYILKHHRKLHKVVGRLYAYNILLINFPTGMIMAFYANGGLPSKAAFIILDCLWCWFTYKAVVEARRKNIIAHKQYMIRSYALTMSAIALRSWKIVLVNTTTLDIPTIYMIDAWLGFVPNLLLAEWIIRRKKWQQRKKLVVAG